MTRSKFYNKAHLFSAIMLFFQAVLLILSNSALAESVPVLLPKAALETITSHYPPEVSKRFNVWDRLLLESQNKTTIEKLELVNQFFNKMAWVDDKKRWNKRDYWATPVETLRQNAGDCEDFSIAKYFTLRALGIPTQQLKISYAKILNDNQPHMILTYYKTPESNPLILDNKNKIILPYSQRKDLQIKFSFNNDGLWLGNNASQNPMDSSSKLLLWADLIKRMKNERI